MWFYFRCELPHVFSFRRQGTHTNKQTEYTNKEATMHTTHNIQHTTHHTHTLGQLRAYANQSKSISRTYSALVATQPPASSDSSQNTRTHTRPDPTIGPNTTKQPSTYGGRQRGYINKASWPVMRAPIHIHTLPPCAPEGLAYRLRPGTHVQESRL